MEAKESLLRVDEVHGENEEFRWPLNQHTELIRSRRTGDAWKNLCIFVLLAIALTTSITTANTYRQLHELQTRYSGFGVGGEFGVPETFRSQLKLKTYQPAADSWKDLTRYSGTPSIESEFEWIGLQTVRGVWVSASEAQSLNISGGLVGPDDATATVLGVMHNIHCIRIIREVLYPEYYSPNRTEEARKGQLIHVGHCLEALRHSVMCNPDMTPYSVHWDNEEREDIAINPSAKQTCVDWEDLVRWETERQFTINDLWEANLIDEESE